MTESFDSRLGVSSRNPITVCTILVVACFSWPCFFDSSSTCSLSKLQSPAFFAIVHIAMRIREVEARSEAFVLSVKPACANPRRWPYLAGLLLQQKELLDRRLRVALQQLSALLPSQEAHTYRSELLGLRDRRVDLLGEVLVGLEHLPARHCGGVGMES
jgi:hypothetical protein